MGKQEGAAPPALQPQPPEEQLSRAQQTSGCRDVACVQGPHLPLPRGNKHFMEALSPDVKLVSKAKENPEMYLSAWPGLRA